MSSKTDKILPLTKNLTVLQVEETANIDPTGPMISKIKILDKTNGNIIAIDPKNPASVKKADAQLNEIKTAVIEKTHLSISNFGTVDVVYSLTSQLIDLTLKTSDGPVEPKVGFLIEIYSSGSDGKLKRLYMEDLEDPLDGNNAISDGFSNYFKLEVDK